MSLRVGASVTLGRSGSALGTGGLDLPGLSREHVRLTATDDDVEVVDMGSKNGFRVNGQQGGSQQLVPGSVLSLPGIHLVARRGEVVRRPHQLGEIRAWGPWLSRLAGRVKAWGIRGERVLLSGAAGTGKQQIAHALHEIRGRGCLVSVDLGVHGLRHGIASGILSDAEGGTVVVGGLETLSLDAQRELVEALDSLSATEGLDARVVLTRRSRPNDTAPPVGLAPLTIELPTLGERREDILSLAAQAGLATGQLSADLALRLLLYSWPGNVRQLVEVAHAARDASPKEAIEDRVPWMLTP